jgi:hypothetical protein
MADEQIQLIEDFFLTDNDAGAPSRRTAAGGRVQ